MKLAIAGKGGVGKTTLAAWLVAWLAGQGRRVFAVDADNAPNLGPALGLDPAAVPEPLAGRMDLVEARVGRGLINLNPEVGDLPESLSTPVAGARLLVLGGIAEAGGGCACAANSLLKALLAHLILEREDWVVVDLEAGVEHLGRGVAASVDGLLVVSEPSRRSLDVARKIADMARDLAVPRLGLALNRADPDAAGQLPPGLPPLLACLPRLPGLEARMLNDPSVLGPELGPEVEAFCRAVLGHFSPRGC